jgi:murein DD-endopeptidase MepM/ murein hydrolase activator NlpD
MNHFARSSVLALCAAAFCPLNAAKAVEIRTCGSEVRIAPLNDERRVQSLLHQSFAIVNNSAVPRDLDKITLELLDKGEVRDVKTLNSVDIGRALASVPQVNLVAQILPGQYCNGALLKGATLAKSSKLPPGEAVVFTHQLFVWRGSRDLLQIRVGETSASIAISEAPAKTRALFPISGLSFVAAGPSLHSHHRWVAVQQFSYDIGMIDKGRTYRGKGNKPSDYFIYGKPVRAVAQGQVVSARFDAPDSVSQLVRAGETDQAYQERIVQEQSKLLAGGIDAILGNHVIIDHGNGEFSVYAHLKPGSVNVKVGDHLAAGRIFAAVGTSGNSTQPHLHFQMCDRAEPAACQSLPVAFDGIRLPIEQTVRTVQSGDFVETLR